MIVPWWIAALFFGIGTAGYISVNQQYKLPAHILAMWRGYGLGLLMLPLVLLTTPPDSWKFYAFVLVNGVLSGYYDNRVFAGSQEFGSGSISRIRSLSVIFSFSLWLGIHPGQFMELVQRPLVLFGIIACLFGCIVAVFLIKKGEVDKAVLKMFFPAIIVAAFIGVFNKSAMAEAELRSAIIYYIFIVSVINGSVNLLVHCRSKKCEFSGEKIFSKKSIKGGIVTILFMSLLMSTKNYSMAYVPNPAYVGALGYTSVLWVILFNKIKGIKDQSNIWLGMALVLSAVFLILLTS